MFNCEHSYLEHCAEGHAHSLFIARERAHTIIVGFGYLQQHAVTVGLQRHLQLMLECRNELLRECAHTLFRILRGTVESVNERACDMFSCAHSLFGTLSETVNHMNERMQ